MEGLNEEIVSRFLKVMRQCKEIPNESLETLYWQQPLTGEHFGFTSVDLLYLLFEVEEEFDVRFSSDLLDEYGFSSIRNICLILQEMSNQ